MSGLALLLALGFSGCSSLTRWRRSENAAATLATTVTITRDEWGVPHIEAPDDASAAFGIGYAQAEDDFVQIEENYLTALGRAASVHGEPALADDLVRAAFEVEALARTEYEREPVERRAVWDAFADGVNYWLRMHPASRPRALPRVEPWYPFAMLRNVSAATVIDSVPLRDVIATPVGQARGASASATATAPDSTRAQPAHDPAASSAPDGGGDAWAIAPSRTAAGHALLFMNPPLAIAGATTPWEVHIHSATGWDVAGVTVPGIPVPIAGHNEQLAWTHTRTTADGEDAWIEHFDHPTDALSYRAGDAWQLATTREADIIVRTTRGDEHRRYRFVVTERGPIIALPDGRRATVRRARFVEGGALQEWYALGHAHTLDEFRTALGEAALPACNTLYADQAGHILFVQGSAMPRRDTRYDWTRPVDGADTLTRWQGYQTLDELPQILDPQDGWIGSTGGVLFPNGVGLQAAGITRETDARALALERVLARAQGWNLDSLAAAAFDTHVAEADRTIPRIGDEWERLGATDSRRAERLDTAIAQLRDWNRNSTIDSPAMTLFVLWAERSVAALQDGKPWPAVRALEDALADLRRAWGSTRVPWGDVNRLQRVTDTDDAATGTPGGLPVSGGPGQLGIIFDFATRPGAAGRRRYGYHAAYLGVVELGATAEARTILTFGQSADAGSSHNFDQARLYASGLLKMAWFTPADVLAHAIARYQPQPPR